MTDDLDLDTIEARARWHVTYPHWVDYGGEDRFEGLARSLSSTESEALAAELAAMPHNVLALTAEVRKLRTERDQYRSLARTALYSLSRNTTDQGLAEAATKRYQALDAEMGVTA